MEAEYSAGVAELAEIMRPVFEKHGVAFAYLFGSVAAGTEHERSDLDLAVYFVGGDADLSRRFSLYGDLSRALARNDIDIVELNTAANLMLLEAIVRSGRVLFDACRDDCPEDREDFELRVLHQAMDFREQRKRIMGI